TTTAYTREVHICITVTGDLNYASTDILEGALTKALAASSCSRVIVDLAGLTSCDSAGLGVLVTAFKRARDAAGSLTLVDIPRWMQRRMEVTGLSQIFPIFPSV